MYARNIPTDIKTLKGVGKQLSASYSQMGVTTCSDLLHLIPRGYEDRSSIVSLASVGENEYANTAVEVIAHSYFGGGRKRTLKVTVQDISGEGDGRASLVCFNRNYLEKVFRIGSRFYLWGLFSHHWGELQSSQFEMVHMAQTLQEVPGFGALNPIYPLSGKLSQKTLRMNIEETLSLIPSIEEEMPEYIISRYHLMSTDRAFRAIHQPKSMDEVNQARRTLAFTELFYLLLMNGRKVHLRSTPSHPPVQDNRYERQLLARLPFSLTADQVSCLDEIKKDLASEEVMNRLLQGDVGSGKTLVAWISALNIIQGGGQVAFMAPTELLARQHAEQAALYLEPLGIRLAFITGSLKQKARKYLLQALREGEIDIAIGTHALFSEDIAFRNLKYIIIDEQHRFGVLQRSRLKEKGFDPDVLMMSATPIPRSLALTVFGDIHVSTIRHLPQGRKDVVTYLVKEESRGRMYHSIRVEFDRGHQAYFVYPRIDDSGESSLRDVQSMFTYLSKEMYPGVPAALIHSKIPEEDKMTILRDFRERKLTYIVSTSVVEVGLDIPSATVMVIEHAERFGLAALHQLRGRVGRSDLQSYCFLVYDTPLTEDGQRRLKVLKETNDGFVISEQDLLIRGPGDIAGVRQSGFLKLRFASLTDDMQLIQEVKQVVDRIIEEDEGLLEARHTRVRNVLTYAPYISEDHTGD